MLVGRDEELAAIASIARAGGAVVVVGEAGIGKTSVLRAAAAAVDPHAREGGGLAMLSWVDHLPLTRALGVALGGDTGYVASAVRRALGDGVLVIDDVQWCDEATLRVLVELVDRVPLLTAVRHTDPGGPETVERLEQAGFTVRRLDPLDTRDATAVVRAGRPGLAEGSVGQIVARAAGNPLLLGELAASGRPAESLRLSLADRLQRLDVSARDSFAMLALAGRPLPVSALPDVTVLVGHDLVTAADGRVAVRHALLAEVLLDDLDEQTARRLHAVLARVSESDGEAARHHHRAGETDAAHACALSAAETASSPGERARHLALAARTATGGRADALRLEAARAVSDVNDWDLLDSVLGTVEDPTGETLAWMSLFRVRNAGVSGRNHEVEGLVATGLSAVEGLGTDVEVLLRVERCRVPIFVKPDPEESIAAPRAALALVRERGLPEFRARYFLGSALGKLGRDGWREELEAARAGARAEGDVLTELASLNNLSANESQIGSPPQARVYALEGAARADELQLSTWVHRFWMMDAGAAWHLGEYAATLATAERLADEDVDARADEDLALAWAMSLTDLGRLEEAQQVVAVAMAGLAADDVGRPPLLFALAENALAAGDPERALLLVDEFLVAQGDIDADEPFARVTQAWARWALDRDPGPAASAPDDPIVAAVPLETAAVQALWAGRHREAAVGFERAGAAWAAYHRRGERRCRWAQAESLRLAGETAEVVVLLEKLEAEALDDGLKPLLARVRQSLRAAGVRRAAARRGGEDVLSEREREVLVLVAQGLGNAQIEKRLGLSRRTVETVLSSAMRKLGATNRAHAAALAGD